jgi:hypothetical protein
VSPLQVFPDVRLNEYGRSAFRLQLFPCRHFSESRLKDNGRLSDLYESVSVSFSLNVRSVVPLNDDRRQSHGLELDLLLVHPEVGLNHSSSSLHLSNVMANATPSESCLKDYGRILQCQELVSVSFHLNVTSEASLDDNGSKLHGLELDFLSVLSEASLDRGGSLMLKTELLSGSLASVCCLEQDCGTAHSLVVMHLLFHCNSSTIFLLNGKDRGSQGEVLSAFAVRPVTSLENTGSLAHLSHALSGKHAPEGSL